MYNATISTLFILLDVCLQPLIKTSKCQIVGLIGISMIKLPTCIALENIERYHYTADSTLPVYPRGTILTMGIIVDDSDT